MPGVRCARAAGTRLARTCLAASALLSVRGVDSLRGATHPLRLRRHDTAASALGARGQAYITLVHDLDARRLLFATEGRDASAVACAADDLRAHGDDPQTIDTVCTDMSAAFIRSVSETMRRAAIAFDRFHVIQLASAALDSVRRQEARTEPRLKRTRWGWMKDWRRWNRTQINDMHQLTRTRLKTARPWRLKEAQRDIYRSAPNTAVARAALERWMSWARCCQLEPIKKLAATLRKHFDGVLHAFGAAHRHNGYVEAVNSLVQAANARARGYGATRLLIAMCYLIAGRLQHLPVSPFATAHHA